MYTLNIRTLLPPNPRANPPILETHTYTFLNWPGLNNHCVYTRDEPAPMGNSCCRITGTNLLQPERKKFKSQKNLTI